jgi:hypothetical protein
MSKGAEAKNGDKGDRVYGVRELLAGDEVKKVRQLGGRIWHPSWRVRPQQIRAASRRGDLHGA